ncbi:hypothetical protein Ccrd_026811 [Cynara cardunculus var. scolymus]|uniref:Uncharacterized protein n=1 Tax=Cynara cardunculus var. scolymus TaxID=59895 RepID=A0A103XCV8_CYNCS|nr:hypothetical protein Ccrd_026811 [Cynara cardunculus var. scolymus]
MIAFSKAMIAFVQHDDSVFDACLICVIATSRAPVLHRFRVFFSLLIPFSEVLCTKRGIITELFMCEFLLKVHWNFFSNDVPIARIRGLDSGISPVQVMYLLEIHR